MGFRLVPLSVTLNGATALILHYFTSFFLGGGEAITSQWLKTDL